MDHLFVVAFPTPAGARGLLLDLSAAGGPSRRAGSIRAEAVVERDRTGGLGVRHEVALTAEPELTAAPVWGLLVSVLAQGPLGGSSWGVPTRLLWRRLVEVGVDERFLEQVVTAVRPGGSALVLRVDPSALDDLQRSCATSGGRLLTAALPDSTFAVLEQELDRARSDESTDGRTVLGTDHP